MIYACFRCCLVSVAIPLGTAFNSQMSGWRLPQPGPVRDTPRTEKCGDFKGAWENERDLEKQSDDLMCQVGKVLPQLYLLGPPKAGTTSLARDLNSAGVQCLADLKENEFWVDHMNNKTFKEVSVDLRLLLKDCSGTDRSLVADFTPENIAVPDMPRLLQSVYGSHWEGIRFIIMLREPLSRLQSQYYFGHDAAGKKVLPLQFQKEVEDLLDTGIFTSFTQLPVDFRTMNELKPISEMAVYCKMGDHLRRWRLTFKARQFMLIPYNSFLKGAAEMKVCKMLSHHLGFSIGCRPEISMSVATEHPPVHEDVSKKVRHRFRDALSEDTSLLAYIIERDTGYGMRVPFYNDGDAEDWLHEHW